MVLESMDFDSTKPWWCVEGGTQQIAEKMQETLKQKEAVKFNKTVAALSYTDEGCDQIDVTVKEDTEPRRYDAVFNSATLGAMQHMQLEGLNLNWGTKSAIRSLGYGASCKVGIRFKTLWWKQEKVLGENCVKLGGQGKTDLPIRTCVYPSYNVDDKANLPGVLLASYTWSQDADRIGSLINRNSPEGEEELKELLIHDLARLHANKSNPGAEMEKDKEYDRLHKIISEAYLDHYAYNWHNNPRTVGAFAYFGPGQFKNMYPYVIRNDGKHIIVGEAASAHHAWVVGALESAVRGVYQFLNRHSKRDNAIYNAAQAYESDAIKEGPYGPLPAEFNRTEDVKLPDGGPQKDTTEAPPVKPSPIGDFARMGVLFEKIRLQQGGDKVDPAAIRSDQVKSIVAVAA
jgi:monoamine oxidase